MNDELNNELRGLHDTLVRHSHDLDGTPLSLDTVRTRARRIRRNRRLAVAGGIAAALVVIVPAGMLATGDMGGGKNTPGPVTHGPAPTKAADPEVSSSGLGLPYAQGTTLTMPDGTEVHLPHPYQQVVVAGGEVYGAQPDTDTGHWDVDVIGDSGVTDSFRSTFELVPDADATVVTWGSLDGRLMSRSQGQERTLLTGQGDVFPIAVLGGPDCAEQADGCTVFYTDSQGVPTAMHSGAGINPVVGDPLKVTDVSADGLISIQTDSTESGSCFAVEDGSGKTQFDTCDYSLHRFSPDGKYVSAGPAYLDGSGSGFTAILDARTGKEVARYAPEGGSMFSFQWEDNSHLLLLQHDGSGWAVKRLAVGGEIADVLGPDDSTDDLTPAYVLGGQQ